MVSGIFFLIFLVGVIIIVAWSAQMDRLPPGARTTGLLAMREPGDDEKQKPSGKRVRRRGP
jgi:hypothetical protein